MKSESGEIETQRGNYIVQKLYIVEGRFLLLIFAFKTIKGLIKAATKNANYNKQYRTANNVDCAAAKPWEGNHDVHWFTMFPITIVV